MPAATPLSEVEAARAEANECACGCGEPTTPSKSYRGKWSDVWATPTCRKRAYKRRKKEGRVVSVSRRARNREVAEIVRDAALAADKRAQARADLIVSRRTMANAWASVSGTLRPEIGHPHVYRYRAEERWAVWSEYDPEAPGLTAEQVQDRQVARKALMETWEPWGTPKPPERPAVYTNLTIAEREGLMHGLMHELAASAITLEEAQRRAERLTAPTRLVDTLERVPLPPLPGEGRPMAERLALDLLSMG